MAAVSSAINCFACQRILLPPPPSSCKPTSCSTGGMPHNFASTKGLSGSSPPVRCRSPYQGKGFLLYNRRTGEEDRIRRGSPASVASEDLGMIPTRNDDQVEELAFEGGADEDVVVGSCSSAPSSSSSSPPPSSSSPSPLGGQEPTGRYVERVVDRAINAAIVLAAGTAVVTKLLTIDHDYWQGWTLYEILRYAPEHNWSAYEEALKTNPVLAKMMISGVVYSLGDWIAQCYEGKPLFEFDRVRMFRSGLVGFTLHGSLSHYYYHFCEALFPFQDWWVVPAKVVFDQTAWSAIWNSIYYLALGFLRFESPSNIISELKATFWSMLTAGWKLWPFAHLVTYGLIPVEQRLLWVDCVELVWVTILSTYSNEKSEARNLEAASQTNRCSSEESTEN